MKKKLVPFSEAYRLAEYDKKPLPDDIFNSEGAILAHKGQCLSGDRLMKVYVYVDDIFVSGVIPDQPDGPPQEVRQTTVQAPPAAHTTQNDDYPAGFELSSKYEEDSALKIETYLQNVEFEPIPKIKTALRADIHNMKEIFQKKIVNNMSFLISPNNEQITRQISEYLNHILNTSLFASDYIDMITAIRTKNNYVTFSHALAMAFYTMAIAKKLKMLREDYLENDNLGRWLPIKTKANQQVSGPVPFSNQLLKHIDRQKETIMLKYDADVKNILFENIHDLMHEYAKLDPKKNPYPSLTPGYDDVSLILLCMSAINSDIGKICIPNHILNKNNDLTKEEWEIIKQHPFLSVSKLKEINVNQPKMFVHIIGHHIIGDETDYPKVNSKLLPETKIIIVSDVYDAMTAPRHYGRINSNVEAVSHVKSMYDKGFIDLPLYLTAVHTFNEFNHAYVKRRHKKITDLGEDA